MISTRKMRENSVSVEETLSLVSIVVIELVAIIKADLSEMYGTITLFALTYEGRTIFIPYSKRISFTCINYKHTQLS